MQPQINVNPRNIPNMRCACGSDLFFPIYNLKYVSPIQIADPKGGTMVTPSMHCCLNCQMIYPCAMPQEQVKKHFRKVKKSVEEQLAKQEALKNATSL